LEFLNFDPLYLEKSTYPIDMYVVSNKLEHEEFKSEVKTGAGSSFSHPYDKKTIKMAKN